MDQDFELNLKLKPLRIIASIWWWLSHKFKHQNRNKLKLQCQFSNRQIHPLDPHWKKKKHKLRKNYSPKCANVTSKTAIITWILSHVKSPRLPSFSPFPPAARCTKLPLMRDFAGRKRGRGEMRAAGNKRSSGSVTRIADRENRSQIAPQGCAGSTGDIFMNARPSTLIPKK